LASSIVQHAGCRTKYRRFATAAEALRYAVEDLRTPKVFGASLEVGDERFNNSEIQRLCEADDFPLRKRYLDVGRLHRDIVTQSSLGGAGGLASAMQRSWRLGLA
jgi:hypothetical protein